MNGELLSVLDYMEREKGIDKERLMEAVEASLLSASRKTLGNIENVIIKIDRQTGDIRAFSELEVVEKVENPSHEISLDEARKIDKSADEGDQIRKEVTPKNFGRIAAQSAKQVIIQKIREAEREIIFSEFKEKVGTLATGVVRRMEHGNVILDLGKTEAILPYKERCPKEEYKNGHRIRVLIISVTTGSRGPEITVSRTDQGLVKKLFELEVPEIVEGTVEIKKIAREPGYRAKIAIASKDDKVDCVGACVGMRGARVKNIVRELNGEKIDIVKWDDDMGAYVANSLSPAELKSYSVDTPNKTVNILVAEDQLALAIGKRGQNARLTAKLTGWKVSINRELTVQDKKNQAMELLQHLEGVTSEEAKALVDSGYTSLETLQEASKDDFEGIEGFEADRIEPILEAAKKGLPEGLKVEAKMASAVFDPEDTGDHNKPKEESDRSAE